MHRCGLPSVLVLLAALGWSAPSPAQDIEDAVYVYDLFHAADNCLELFARLRRLPLRPMVILSVEQGPDFILDHPAGEERLRCVLRFLNGSSRRVKALFLQDPVFLEGGQEAVRRAALLGDFVARHPGELAGAQVDVEPHGHGTWPNGSAAVRRRLLEGLYDVLRQVRPRLAGLPLGVVVPWWYADMARELPGAAPEALFQAADELYLMTYGDGNPTPGENHAASLLARLDGAYAFSDSGRTHVVLSTREFPSAAHLETELQRLRWVLAFQPNFAGTAVFHASSGFQTVLSGPPPRPSGVR